MFSLCCDCSIVYSLFWSYIKNSILFIFLSRFVDALLFYSILFDIFNFKFCLICLSQFFIVKCPNSRSISVKCPNSPSTYAHIRVIFLLLLLIKKGFSDQFGVSTFRKIFLYFVFSHDCHLEI